MNLFSPEFIGFYLIILFLYYQLKNEWQQILLLLASSFFISSYSFGFLVYTFLFVFLNYANGIIIDKYKGKTSFVRMFCNIGILLNVFSLVFFKYTNFIIENLNTYLNFAQKDPFPSMHILIPLGISYYTFQGISYTLQVYRGHEPAEKNLVVFSNYFIFFPKFLAGPIELSKEFIPQLHRSYQFNYDDVVQGFKLILWGAFKKMVIADRLSLLINGVYSDVGNFSGNPLLVTFLLQPLHLYCDFSGYTDLALGIGRSFGFKLTNNFNRPFFATSVSNFWRRWHISLSNWCNEFIFKRLTFKNRNWGIWSSVYAVFVTFFVIGIWHGPRWNFVILGLLQGIAINYEFFTKRARMNIAQKLPPSLVLYTSRLLTYIFFCFTLIFFNAETFGDAMTFIKNMFINIDLTSINVFLLSPVDKTIAFVSLLFVMWIELQQERGKNLLSQFNSWPKWVRVSCYYVAIILIMYFGGSNKELVYMQF